MKRNFQTIVDIKYLKNIRNTKIFYHIYVIVLCQLLLFYLYCIFGSKLDYIDDNQVNISPPINFLYRVSNSFFNEGKLPKFLSDIIIFSAASLASSSTS